MKLLIFAAIVGAVVAQNQYNLRGQQQQRDHHHQRDQQPQQQQQYQQEEPRPQQQIINDRQPSTTTFIPILSWNKEQEHDGTYKTSYETGNNIISEENGYLKEIGEGENRVQSLVQRGSYSYPSPDGRIITTYWEADETGFHVQGDHLPIGPKPSEEVQKGLDLIYAGIKQQEEEAALEAKKPQQPFNQQIDRREDNKNYRL